MPGTKGKNKRKEESTQSMSTVEGKKQEKRRALLDAAYELFLERGTAKTSVEDITSRAKVAKGTFYLYFQDKGAVMQALLGRGWTRSRPAATPNL